MIYKTTPGQAPRVSAAVDGRIMHQQASVEVILLSLQAGESIPLHLNPSDVLFAGIQGQATLVTPGQTLSLGPAETIFVSASEQRSWENRGSQLCKILVIKIL